MWKYIIVFVYLVECPLFSQEIDFQYLNPDQIPDSIAMPIIKRLDWEIFNYRMILNPAYSEEDYTQIQKDGNDNKISRRRWDIRSRFLEKQDIPSYVGPLLFEISYLKSPNGYIHNNFFVLQKIENSVAELNLKGETIRSPVNLFEDYFPNGERYLVYYDYHSFRRPLMISGRVLWEPLSTKWLKEIGQFLAQDQQF